MDEDMVEETVEEEEEEAPPPPKPVQKKTAPQNQTSQGQRKPRPDGLRTKAAPPTNYQRVRSKDVNFDELRRARGRVVYRFMIGFILAIFGIICLVRFQVYQYPLPWKVTDPSNPNFRVNAFKFTDYQTAAKLGPVLQVLLPAGTSKQTVDQLLGHIGHAHTAPLPPKKGLPANQRQISYIYEEQRNLMADMISYFAVSHDNVRRWIIIVTYAAPSAQVVSMTTAMDSVEPITEAYTNISPQSMDSNYWN